MENVKNQRTIEKAQQQTGLIDVHHHILPPDYTSALANIGIRNAGGATFPNWSVQKALNFMDQKGIATAITSISSPGVYFGDNDFSITLAKRCNEFSANLISDNPNRFGGFAVLPLPNVDAALKELEYAIDNLQLDGVVLLTNIDGHYLGAPIFDEVFAELNRREAIVFIHPTTPAYGELSQLKMPAHLLEFVFDTTRAISNLILNNTFERFPNIRFIVSHAGGTAPYLAARITALDFGFREEYKIDTTGHLKNLYYDTALSAAPSTLRALQELVDPSHILFGSDYPFVPTPVISKFISLLEEYDGFDEKSLKAIGRESALKLFPRFSTE
ncbi:MAG: amidohydrolase family protein [Pseudomonadales bacterium]